MAKILLPVLAVDDNEVAANFFVEQFRSYSEHLINALEATYELTYVTSNEEAAQLLGEDSGIRLALALNSSSADPVEASGFLQRGGSAICQSRHYGRQPVLHGVSPGVLPVQHNCSPTSLERTDTRRELLCAAQFSDPRLLWPHVR